jgi:hypothetical protein
MTAHSSVQSIALNVARKHGLWKCQECADELKTVSGEHGIRGKVLRFSTVGLENNAWIMMKDPKFPLPFPTC